jgi:hypothetical protein
MRRGEYAETVKDDETRLWDSFEKGTQWTNATAHVAFGWNERRFRAVVSKLRESGYPVIATSEAGSTYRKALNRSELEAFIERELVTRTRDLEQQIRALRDGADKYFSGVDQLRISI